MFVTFPGPSSIEHPAVLECLEHWKSMGMLDFDTVPADTSGIVPARGVIDAIRDDTCLVTIMHSNNELGSLQPIEEIGHLLESQKDCQGRHILFHTDAAQSISKVDVDVSKSLRRVDMATIVGHKFGAPKGIGALYVKSGTVTGRFLHGGGQEKGTRGGTENVLHIVGMGMAAEIARREMQATPKQMAKLRNTLQEEILKQFKVNACSASSSPPLALAFAFASLSFCFVLDLRKHFPD